MTSPVRIATIEDEPEIIRLLHLMHAESGLLSLDVEAAKEVFSRAFLRKGGIIGVMGEKNNIEGMIYLLITRHWYTRDNHLEELFNFIRPDCRRSGHAKSLITFAKSCSDQIGIPLVIGVFTNERVVEKVRLYRRSLGVPCGAFWVYNAKWVAENMSGNEDFWRAPFPSHSTKRNGKNGSKQQLAFPIAKEA